jgi:hypothetical protein
MRSCLILATLLLAPNLATSQISGQVIDAVSGTPIADARVRIQTRTGPPAISDAMGQFELEAGAAGPVTVTASLTHDPARPINYITAAAVAEDGDAITLALPRLPADDVTFPYDPGTSFNCASCHQMQHQEWLQSTHGNAARNEWVLDLFSGTGSPGGAAGYVFRDTHDDDDSGFCATCHAPLEDAQNPGAVFLDQLNLAAGYDGVTCLACHQMADVNDNVSALHHLGNTQYRFPDDDVPEFWVWGPLDDVSFTLMRASYQPGFSSARFCASCHEYNNPVTGAPGQNTYSEWLASPFAQPGESFRSCQDCHMPAASEAGPVSSLGGQPVRAASQRRSHTLTGANATTLDAAIDLDINLSQPGHELVITAEVSNVGAGHRFPTGISIRNALLVIEAHVDGQPLPLSAGEVIPFYGSAADSQSDDDLAGQPGKGFARVLAGRINGQGPMVRPVLFIDAEEVWADTTIAPGDTDISIYRFALDEWPEGTPVEVSARLLYRRAWRDLAVTKGWTTTPTGGPIEIEVARSEAVWQVAGSFPDPSETVPVTSLRPWALILLAFSLWLAVRSSLRTARNLRSDA